MVIYLLHKDTRKYATVPKKRWIKFHKRSTWGFLEEATRCVLQVASPLNAWGRSSKDHKGSRRNPGWILLNGVSFGRPGALFDLAISFAGICLLSWAPFCPGSQFPRPIPGSRDASFLFPDYLQVSFPLSHQSLRGFRRMGSGVFFGFWSRDRVLGGGSSFFFRSSFRGRSVFWFLHSVLDFCRSFGFVFFEHSFWQFSTSLG